ncbi:transcription cofactor vestigial-like protein 3 [Penaeus chinensis]|uniref:transcription cofactor vestigial-like protein 3 n=1 Tax=Penaeus chinensis TaxID=139456 RepID=UPI001FB5BA8E|nr:transcription cofactor vestigial-like protein 3 [Penaeus chinensis]
MMAGVMYQGYASYLQAYQRHSNPYCPTTPLALNHYDKKYRLQDAAGGGGASQPPTPDLQQQQQQQQQHQQFSSPSTSSAAAAALPNPQTASAPVVAPTPAAPPATPAAAAAAAAAHAGSSPVASQQQQTQQQQQAVSHSTKSEEKAEQHADAHYISANCVVLTYFSGDLATAVDEHFSRALTQSFSKSTKDPCPMSQRNLPASFWNSHYHAGMSGYPTAGSSVTLTGHESLYPDYSSLHGLHQGDPWAYNLTAAGQYGHHRSMADFTYMPSSSRYPHNYSSLLMGRPRLPQCVVGKADPWSTAPRLHDDVTLDPTAAYTHHFSSMTGLEGTGATQEASKDLYWF